MITEQALLFELETVSHAERVRRMGALGHQAQTDPEVATLLRTLETYGNFFPRYLSLLSCFGSKDVAHILRALTDESRLLRGIAVRLIPTACTPEQIATVLDSAPPILRMTLLRGLVRRHRRDAIDIYLHRLTTQSVERLAAFLPFGSAAVVDQYASLCTERWGSTEWSRIARFHSLIAVRLLREEAAGQTESNPRLRLHANYVLSELPAEQASAALPLVRDLLRYEAPSRVSLQRVSQWFPNEIADLLLAHESGGTATVCLDKTAHHLSRERLVALLQQRPTLLRRPEIWLRRLDPDSRRAAYTVAGESWRNKDGVMNAAIVALLPTEIREREARRHLALPILATRPEQRLPYAAFLPWDEARAALDPFVRNPDPDLRSVALSALIGVARYHRERLDDVLSLVKARGNEQDPIRRVMLTALSVLPSARWTRTMLPELDAILQDMLGAADLSPATSSEGQKLVSFLIPFHPEWSAPLLGKMVQLQGAIYFRVWEKRLTDAEARRILPSLLPVLTAWETRERERHLIAAADAFGRRLRVLPEVTDLLERVLMSTKTSYLASQVLQLLKTHRPDRLAVVVPQLLESDPSAITLPVVYEHLHRKRQDLLPPYLGQQAYSGRFGTGKTRFVLSVIGGFNRWSSRQQNDFATTLRQVLAEETRDTPALQQVIRQLVALPAIDPAFLMRLANLEETRLAVRDTMIRELAHLDSGQGVPVLLDAMGDSRARVAIYALRSALLQMPPDRALELLRQVPLKKVTVAKEVLRLMGELDTPAVYPVLLEMSAETLHRDVRVALLRALRDHLEEPQTWAVLNAAATDADPAVAASVIRIPTDRVSRQVQQRLLDLTALLLTHPDAKVRLDTLNRCAELPLADTNRTLLPGLLARLGSPLPDECSAAARSVFATYAGNTAQDVAVIAEAVTRIRGDRRVLLTILDTLHTVLNADRARLRPTVRAVLTALESDPITARYRAVLAIAGLDWEEIAAYLLRLSQTGALHAEALMAAATAIVSRGGSVDGFRLLETTWAAQASDALRRLALSALLAQATSPSGWTGERRMRLEEYRSDTSPLVAAAAQFTLPPP